MIDAILSRWKSDMASWPEPMMTIPASESEPHCRGGGFDQTDNHTGGRHA
jgi:hypothetical protein